jgi:hypothetical protein
MSPARYAWRGSLFCSCFSIAGCSCTLARRARGAPRGRVVLLIVWVSIALRWCLARSCRVGLRGWRCLRFIGRVVTVGQSSRLLAVLFAGRGALLRLDGSRGAMVALLTDSGGYRLVCIRGLCSNVAAAGWRLVRSPQFGLSVVGKGSPSQWFVQREPGCGIAAVRMLAFARRRSFS